MTVEPNVQAVAVHALGPHVVGRRVVVRRVLPGETGPSGGPAMTDVLGICESWQDGVTVIRREDGSSVSIETRDIVSGKPVPPRPSARLRVSAAEIHHRAMEGMRSRSVDHAGQWVLRATGGSTGRTNSALAVEDPQMPFDEAVERVLAFYAAHDQQPLAQVVVGSEIHAAFEERGWQRARPDEADVDVLLASVAQVRRALAVRLPLDRPAVVLHEHLSRDWLLGNTRAQANVENVRFQLEGETPVRFAEITDNAVPTASQRARGSATYSRDWTVLANLTVQPAHRRQGLALVVMDALLDWAGEQGAATVTLQVISDNEPATTLYESLGFERHHQYRYLATRRSRPARLAS